MRFCFDFVVRFLKFFVHVLKLVCSPLFFIVDFSMILVLVRHLLDLFLNFSELCVLVFNVTLTFCYVLLELNVQIYEHVFPINDIFETIG